MSTDGREHLVGRRRRGLRDGARRAHGGLDELGCDEDPSVGHGVVGVEDLERADRVDLSDRERDVVGRFPVGRGGQEARRLTREVQPGRLAETERLDLVEQAALTDSLGDQPGPDVRRLGQDLRRGQLLGRVGFCVVEGRTVQLDLIRHGEDRVGVDQSVLQSGGERDQLEDRPRLVELGHREVARRLVHGVVGSDRHHTGRRRGRGGRCRADGARMICHQVRHGEDLARLDVHDDWPCHSWRPKRRWPWPAPALTRTGAACPR